MANAAKDLPVALLEVARSTATQRDLGTLLHLVEVLATCASFAHLSFLLHDPARNVMRLHSVTAFHPTPGIVDDAPVPETPADTIPAGHLANLNDSGRQVLCDVVARPLRGFIGKAAFMLNVNAPVGIRESAASSRMVAASKTTRAAGGDAQC